jgi:hypothetical protein
MPCTHHINGADQRPTCGVPSWAQDTDVASLTHQVKSLQLANAELQQQVQQQARALQAPRGASVAAAAAVLSRTSSSGAGSLTLQQQQQQQQALMAAQQQQAVAQQAAADAGELG